MLNTTGIIAGAQRDRDGPCCELTRVTAIYASVVTGAGAEIEAGAAIAVANTV